MAGHPPTETGIPPSRGRSALCLALSLTAVHIGLVLLGLHPHYQGVLDYGGNSDDSRAAMFVSGVTVSGEASEKLLYSSWLIGHVLKQLYTVSPDVPWYGLYLTGTHLLACFAIGYAWFRMAADWKQRLAVAAFLLAYGTFFWISMSFTQVACLAAIAGASLIASAVIEEAATGQRTIFFRRILCGWSLVIFAWQIRWTSAALVLATATILGLDAWDRQLRSSSPGWSEFNEFDRPTAHLINNRRATSLLFDHETLSADTAAALKSVGWSHNDAKLFRHWFYLDEDVFSFEKIARADTELTSFSPAWSEWRASFQEVGGNLATLPLIWLLLLLSAAVLNRTSFRVQAAGILMWFGVATLLTVLHLFMKHTPHVMFSAASAAFVAALILAACSRAKDCVETSGHEPSEPDPNNSAAKSKRRREKIATLLLLAAAGLALVKTRDHYRLARTGVRFRAEFLKLVEQLEHGPERIHVVAIPFPFHRVSPFDTMQNWDDWNFIYLDGDLRSPRHYALLDEHRIEDLLAALYLDRRVRLITTSERMELLVEFLREHRGIETEAVVERELPPMTVYQLREKTDVSNPATADSPDR